uniref:hypothetical protein n=1 Tax=Boseongicola sp. H5 TaxID=2763261 RepID=UPI001D0B5D3D
DGAATIGRSAGMSTGLSGLFGGVLNLANAIRASLVSAAAIGTGVAMNQSGDGDGNDPRGDDDGDQQPGNEPPDPNREVAELLEAITTGEGLSRDAGERIAEAIEGRTQGDAEDFLDRLLRDGLGWERLPARNDLGERWVSLRTGQSVRTSTGYPDGNFTGPSIKSGGYADINIGGFQERVGLR